MFLNVISRNGIFKKFLERGRSQTKDNVMTKIKLNHQVLYIIRKVLIKAIIFRKQNEKILHLVKVTAV